MKKWKMNLALSLCLLAGCASAPAAPQTENDEPAQTPLACEAGSENCEAKAEAEADFTEIEFDDAIALFEEGKSGVLYFGFAACPWCEEAVPILDEEAKKAGTQILFVRTRDENKERLYTDEQKEKIQKWIEKYMSENEEGELTLYVPLVVRVENGEAVAGHQGTVEEHDAHERKMSADEQKEVRKIYAELVKPLA